VRRYNGTASSTDFAFALVADNTGNSYVTGYSTGSGTGKDLFTIKYDAFGLPLWTARFNGQHSGGDYSFAIALDNSGNVYITGRSDRGPAYLSDITTIKYDNNGNQLWVALYDGPDHQGDEGKAIAVDAAGNVYVTGKSNTLTQYDDIVTIKYNTAGGVQWVNRYNGPVNNYDIATGISLDNSGNVFVCGESVGIGGADILLIKLNPDGTKAWDKRYNGPASGGDGALGVKVDPNGNIITAGFSDGGSTTNYDFATLKYDQNGNQVWVQRYNTNNQMDVVKAMTVDASGNVIVTGSTVGFIQIDSNFATVKYSSSGQQIWVAHYTRTGGSVDVSRAVTTDPLGNVYVTGTSSFTGADNDYITIKYSSAGGQEWIYIYDGPGSYNDVTTAITVNNSGSVYITGRSFSASGDYDYTTVKYSILNGLNQNGNRIPESFGLYQNYPNPFNPATNIRFDIPVNSQAELVVFDISGRTILRENFGMLAAGEYNYVFNTNAPGLSSGIYFYRLNAGDFTSANKMVLVK
jgi:uncharacterized delta-60 repeat protein